MRFGSLVSSTITSYIQTEDPVLPFVSDIDLLTYLLYVETIKSHVKGHQVRRLTWFKVKRVEDRQV